MIEMTTPELKKMMGNKGYITEVEEYEKDIVFTFVKGEKWISVLWNTKIDYLIGFSWTNTAKQFKTENHNDAYEYILSVA